MNVEKYNDLRKHNNSLAGCNSLNIWEQPRQMKIAFMYEIKSVFNAENVCYNSVLNLLSSSLLSINTKTSVYSTIVTLV
jgi:hypothetical protein